MATQFRLFFSIFVFPMLLFLSPSPATAQNQSLKAEVTKLGQLLDARTDELRSADADIRNDILSLQTAVCGLYTLHGSLWIHDRNRRERSLSKA